MTSIRKRLLRWLVAALALSGVALIVTTYFYGVREFDTVSDEELKHIAYALRLNGTGPEAEAFHEANPEFLFATRAIAANGRVVFEGGLIGIRFTGPLTTAEGFSDVDSSGRRWRVFTHALPQGTVQVAQPIDVRRALARELALRMLKPIAIAIPVIALVFWWFLNHALAPLRETSELVRARAPGFLEPMPRGREPDELRPLLDAIDDLIRRVSAALETQRRFVADAAHELRSPLTALKLQVQLAERAGDEPARVAALDALRSGVERASRLVEQLLSLARADRPPDAEGTTDLAALARDIVSAAAVRADAAGIDVGADADAEAILNIPQDAARSLVSNLLDNALRYTPRGGTVTVGVRRDHRTVSLEIVDTGPGIPLAERERVFERFFRGEGAPAEGSGLGLAIVKTIAERHGATISLADANPGADAPGLRIRVDFPIVAPRRRSRSEERAA